MEMNNDTQDRSYKGLYAQNIANLCTKTFLQAAIFL